MPTTKLLAIGTFTAKGTLAPAALLFAMLEIDRYLVRGSQHARAV